MKNSKNSGISLQEQLIKECKAMAKYAFAEGLQVPTEIAISLDSISVDQPIQSEYLTPSGDAGIDKSSTKTKSQNGSKSNIKQLSQIHNQLTQLIAPAKPRTILLLDSHKGSVPLVKSMLIVAVVSLISIIGISLHGDINVDNAAQSWLQMEGFVLLVNLLFLLFASALGASFASLFEVNRYIVKGTFDPKYQSSYWIRFVLGLIAGIMLAELIPDFSGESSLQGIGKPALAMLGGFSASLVYRILKRLITAVEALVRGDAQQLIENQERAAKNEAAQEITQNRLTLATELVKLKQKIGKDLSPDQMNEMINGMLNKMLPYAAGEEETETKSPV
jgi:hypothetical protein